MKPVIRIIGVVLFELLHALSVFMIGYVLVVLLYAPFTRDAEKTNDLPTETIYLSTSGIHTDIILPIKHKSFRWDEQFNIPDLFAIDTFQTHLKFGWGDRNFFLKTKNWSDLTAGTLFKTVFGSGPGAMHLILCTPKDLSPEEYVKIKVTPNQYVRICQFIAGSFRYKDGKATQIVDHPYGDYNYFFESSLTYSMAYTCNSWTNDVLVAGGQKACVWTPFRTAIWAKYKP